jgi:hypothetical protein
MLSSRRAVVLLLAVAAALVPAARGAPAPRVRPGHASKDGLSLTVTLNKRAYRPNDGVVLHFALKNETRQVLVIEGGHLAPTYHEAGPGRHFEVHVKADGKRPLFFWSGTGTEGHTSGVRKPFVLKPGEALQGIIRLSAGADNDRARASLPHEDRGGTFEDQVSRKAHVLGRDARKYTVALRYRVRPSGRAPVAPKDGRRWVGEMTTAPLAFTVAGE